MDLIIAALVAGAAAAAKDTAEKSIKEAYERLKELIKKRFADNEAAKVVLDEHEKDPQTYEAALKKKLTEAGVDRDEEIKKVAQEVMKKEDPQGAAAGKYDLRGSQGVQIGDSNTQNNTFK
ncbi:conserved hypothetical protein [Gloeothece citriformis PCC 7424]|uniref:Uncharacterized protein n=1 Tax=Gloeothece citriformis (strain PCC 7424) TaxID=65393 RepID=B7K9A0_GLOC7|nr:hypothetical protein [Gloeothece citriformis]ACK68583.1 conserved hypothetical protein [Gloeothece citriformis PCC 7424]